MEGTSDFDLAMEWYLKYGEREVVFEMGTVGGGEQVLWEKQYLKNSTPSTMLKITEIITPSITTKALKLIREHNGTNSRG